MKSPKRLMALALAATLMCLPGASLAEDAAATDAPAAIEETTTTVAEDPNEVLATVNGVEITRARFNTFYQSMLSYYGQYYDTTNESLQAAIRQSALTVAVQYAVMDQKLVELGLSLTDEEIAAVLSKYEGETAADELLHLAISRGAPDNVTLIVLDDETGGDAC